MCNSTSKSPINFSISLVGLYHISIFIHVRYQKLIHERYVKWIVCLTFLKIITGVCMRQKNNDIDDTVFRVKDTCVVIFSERRHSQLSFDTLIVKIGPQKLVQ